MATTLLDLPKEVHELICSFLDCNACEDLDKQQNHRPEPRQDLENVGLTCHQLHEAAVPVYSSMLGPTESTHRQRVEAAARPVFDSAEYAESILKCPPELQAYAQSLRHKLLGEVDDWSDVDAKPLGHLSFELGEYFQTGFHQPLPTTSFIAAPPPDEAFMPGYDIQKKQRIKSYRDLRYQLDALAVVILCLPANVKSIVFRSWPTKLEHTMRHEFALHVMAATMDIFGNRMESLSAITYREGWGSNFKVLMRPNICTQLKVLQSLTLDVGYDHEDAADTLNGLRGWHALASTIKHLGLCNMTGTPHHLGQLVKGFTGATTLCLDNVGLAFDQGPVTEWLVFLIDIRCAMPDLAIGVRSLRGCEAATLTRSAVNWIMNSAIPVGYSIGYELRLQLLVDFVDYLPFWKADDGEKGEQAREARKDGKLAEKALSSRFRGR